MQPNLIGDFIRKTRKMGDYGSIPNFSNLLKVNKNTLGSYERGETLPDIEFLANFSSTTNISFLKLLKLRLESSKDQKTRSMSAYFKGATADLTLKKDDSHKRHDLIINMVRENNQGKRPEEIENQLKETTIRLIEIADGSTTSMAMAMAALALLLESTHNLTKEGYQLIIEMTKAINSKSDGL